MGLRHLRVGRLIVVAVLAAGATAGCSGGGGDHPSAPAEPAADVDPSADGAVTGPINRARQTADDAEQRNADLEQRAALDP